jgi:MFS superfamily sulfate permease-like transporter
MLNGDNIRMKQPGGWYYFRQLDHDIPAGIVVFLVALPLCLGVALTSGAPLMAGMIAGIVGGIVVSWASGSQLSVSGPAAGLTMIVLQGIESVGGYSAFLLAVVLAGLLQLILGYLRAGLIGAYFPSAVIKGMLTAIGLILIMKQLPHAVGYGADLMGEETYFPETPGNTWSELVRSLDVISPGAAVVSSVAVLIMLIWETPAIKAGKVLSRVPGPLVAVIWGVLFNIGSEGTALAIADHHLVSLPELENTRDILEHMMSPDFSQYANPEVLSLAVTLAIIASLETLLSLEAADKLDPLRRVAPTNRELKAQGLGNMISGLLGGIPITAVIVRTSANVNAGGKTKVAAFVHGVLLLFSILFVAHWLNYIPLAALAAILLITGYKLANPTLLVDIYRRGHDQIIPYLITVAAILATDLLKGIAVGMVCGLFFVMRANFHAAISLTRDGSHYLLRLRKDVSFLNKALLRELLSQIEADGQVIIDGGRAEFIDQDILGTLRDFLLAAPERGIVVEVHHIPALKHPAASGKPLPGPDGKH